MTTPPPAQDRGFRKVIVRGLAILLPSILTFWILWAAFVFLYGNVAEPINAWTRRGIIAAMPAVPPDFRPAWYDVTATDIAQFRRSQPSQGTVISDGGATALIRAANLRQFWNDRWYLRATGLVVAIVLIWLAGLVLGGFVGRRAYLKIEQLISRIPGFKQIYPHVKQLVELILGERPMAFSRVVLIEFPRPGSWAMGFVTSSGLAAAARVLGGDTVCVFVPTTPTPFTGFTLVVRSDQVIDLPISIDEAFRYVVTGGVLVPGGQVPPATMAPRITGSVPA